MTPDEVKNVVLVYNHLIDREDRGWDELDELICYLEYLDDDQLHREADVLYCEHAKGKVRCPQDHKVSNCFIPKLVDAVFSIMEIYKETNQLHVKNRYILEYYLAMSKAEIVPVEYQ